MEKSALKTSIFRGKRRALVVSVIVVLILAAAYLVLALAIAGKTSLRATALGVDVSNLSTDDAVARVDKAMTESLQKPITVQAEDNSATVTGADLGLHADAKAVIASVTGFSLNPTKLWRHFFGSEAISIEPKIDQQAQDKVIRRLESELNRKPVSASVSYQGTTAHLAPAKSGINLNVDSTLQSIIEAWNKSQSAVQASYESIAPQVSDEDAAKVMDQAKLLSAGDIRFSAANEVGVISAAEIASATTFDLLDGHLKPVTDWDKLAQALASRVPAWNKPAVDARIVIGKSAPEIIPHAVGISVLPQSLKTATAAALKAPDRTAPLELTEAKPNLTTEEAEKLGVKEVVGEFSTPYPSSGNRDANLRRGMEKISNILLKPGDEFSLEKALGPITPQNGFKAAGVLINGKHEDAMGGGLSQVCVTTLNAAFFAGFDITAHRPHTRYLRRYPAGRECTLWTGTLDLKFKNNTPYGALLQGWLSGGRVHVRVWSTKYWQVKESTSRHMNIVPSKAVPDDSPDCQPTRPGNAGFSVRVHRTITHGDKTGKPINWSWTYSPDDGISCTRPKE